MTDDQNGRVTLPDIAGAEARLAEMTADRDRWRERFMLLRSRLHGIRDSLHRLDSELGRIIDEK